MKKNNKRQFSRKTAICFFGIILFLLLSGCSDPSMKDDPSKGTIILNLGGVPSTSRTAAMSDIQYEVTLYNEGISGDDGTPGGTFEAGASISIPVAPGTYRVGIRAYLKGAVYADGETGWNGSDPHVKITAGSSKGVKIVMEVYLSSYLNDPAFASAAEIDLPLAFTNLDSAKWGEILSAIDGQSKPVNLDLSACKVPGGTVDPGTGNAGGKAKIKSLILPAAATAIADGTSSAATFAGFNGLTTVKMGSGIVTIGDYAFSGLPITSVDLSGVEKIETHAFENCSSLASIVFSPDLFCINNYAFGSNTALQEVNIPGGIIFANAFNGCTSLTTITIGGGCTIGYDAFVGLSNNVETVVIGGAGVNYSWHTGLPNNFEGFLATIGASSGFIPPGKYEWDGATWNHTP